MRFLSVIGQLGYSIFQQRTVLPAVTFQIQRYMYMYIHQMAKQEDKVKYC